MANFTLKQEWDILLFESCVDVPFIRMFFSTYFAYDVINSVYIYIYNVYFYGYYINKRIVSYRVAQIVDANCHSECTHISHYNAMYKQINHI